MSCYKYYNPNPKNKRVGDCVIRAIAKALDIDWSEAYILAITEGYSQKDMPSSNYVWGLVLKKHGFEKFLIAENNDCVDCITAEAFCLLHSHGTYVLGFGSHVATVKDGYIYDSWDSTNEIPLYYWKKVIE